MDTAVHFTDSLSVIEPRICGVAFIFNVSLKSISIDSRTQAFYYTIVGYPEKDLAGEIALVTGGGGGLGRLLSLRLARLGVRVIVWDINQEGNYSCSKTTNTYTHSHDIDGNDDFVGSNVQNIIMLLA